MLKPYLATRECLATNKVRNNGYGKAKTLIQLEMEVLGTHDTEKKNIGKKKMYLLSQ